METGKRNPIGYWDPTHFAGNAAPYDNRINQAKNRQMGSQGVCPSALTGVTHPLSISEMLGNNVIKRTINVKAVLMSFPH